MPNPYMPPHPRRTQAARSARSGVRQRRRWWWTAPLLGLLPVLVVVAVLASQGRLGTSALGGSPVATTGAAAQGQATPSASSVAAGATVTRSGATLETGAATAAPAAATTAVAANATQAAREVAPPMNPAATATTATHTTAGGPFKTYRVQPGDTVKFVAQVYGVSPASIAQASGLASADQLKVGQVLTIPSQPGWLYRVQPDETLDQIAARSGLATELIVSASNLSTGHVEPGDVILIPDRSSASASK